MLFKCYLFTPTELGQGYVSYSFIAMVLVGKVLEAARKKTNVVPYQKRSAENISCVFFL